MSLKREAPHRKACPTGRETGRSHTLHGSCMYTRLTVVLSRYCMRVLLAILKMYGFHPLIIPDLYFAIIEGVPLCDKEPQHSNTPVLHTLEKNSLESVPHASEESCWSPHLEWELAVEVLLRVVGAGPLLPPSLLSSACAAPCPACSFPHTHHTGLPLLSLHPVLPVAP